MVVFWRQGYDGASLTDLTAAMGIERTSLYAAFGNKEALFEQALDRYLAGPSGYVEAALAEPTARRAAQQLLRGAADLHTGPETPPGCMVVQGALACREGRQVYWVCTLIEENDELDATPAQATFESLQALLPGVRVGLVHGRLKASEKLATMVAFKAGQIDLLVATTVIEVGVDVPNASLW